MSVTRYESKNTVCFFFNDTATTEIYTLSLHDALPISVRVGTGSTTLDNIPVTPVSPGVFETVMSDGKKRAVLVRVAEDRKSTRLNSSHSQISYAVFCLKKKKQQIRHSSWPCATHYNLP